MRNTSVGEEKDHENEPHITPIAAVTGPNNTPSATDTPSEKGMTEATDENGTLIETLVGTGAPILEKEADGETTTDRQAVGLETINTNHKEIDPETIGVGHQTQVSETAESDRQHHVTNETEKVLGTREFGLTKRPGKSL